MIRIKKAMREIRLRLALRAEFHDPLYVWRRAGAGIRGRFKGLRKRVKCGRYRWMYGDDASLPDKFMGLSLNPLGWKMKFGGPRFEYEPSAVLKLWRWQIRAVWIPVQDAGSEYAPEIFWETLLWMSEKGASLEEAIESNTWRSADGEIENARTLGMLSGK